MVRSSTRGAQRRSNPCLRRGAMDSFASLSNDGKAYRPTITPITFGAARYFSSILTCNNSVFALACSASASASGDCRRSRRKYRW